MKQTNKTTGKKTLRRWTEEEDDRLIHYAQTFPHKMSFCFTAVAEEIGRTPGAVAYRWYNHLSKRDDVWAFAKISSQGVNKNRSLGMPTPTKKKAWQGKLWAEIVKILTKFGF